MPDDQEVSPSGVWNDRVYKILSASTLLLLVIGTIGYRLLGQALCVYRRSRW